MKKIKWEWVLIFLSTITVVIGGWIYFTNKINLEFDYEQKQYKKGDIIDFKLELRNNTYEDIEHIEAIISLPKELEIQSVKEDTVMYTSTQDDEVKLRVSKDKFYHNDNMKINAELKVLSDTCITLPKKNKSFIFIKSDLNKNKPIQKQFKWKSNDKDIFTNLNINIIKSENNSKNIKLSNEKGVLCNPNEKLIEDVNIINDDVDENNIIWSIEDSLGETKLGKGKYVEFNAPDKEGTYNLIAYYEKDKIKKQITVISKETLDQISKEIEPIVDTYDENNKDNNDIYNEDNINQKEENKQLTLTNQDKSIEVKLIGKENLLKNAKLEQNNKEFFKAIPGVIGEPIDIVGSDDIEKININYKYDLEDINNKNLDVNNLKLYIYDFEDKKLKEVKSILNSKYISADVERAGVYIVADSKVVITDFDKTDIVFNIDYSLSMEDNDPNNKRNDATKMLVKSLFNKYNRFGLIKFYGENEVLHELSNDLTEGKLFDIFFENIALREKTYIKETIISSINMFNRNVDKENENNRKIMILLTDGEDSRMLDALNDEDQNLYNELRENTIKAAQDAKQYNISIYTIGLGSRIDEELLKEISSITKGKYIHIDNIEELENEFEVIQEQLKVPNNNNQGSSDTYEYIDENIKALQLADNGFRAEKDGFKFKNFSSKGVDGTCHGLASVSALNYVERNKLMNDAMPNLVKSRNLELYKDFKGVDGYNIDDNYLELSQELINALDINYLISQYCNYDTNTETIEGTEYVYMTLKEEKLDFYIRDIGLCEIAEKQTKNGNTVYITEYPKRLKDVDRLNIDDNKVLTKEDIETLKSLTWWWDMQDYKYGIEVNDLDSIIEYINNKPYVLRFFWKDSNEKRKGHSVVAQRILKDYDKEGVYYIEVYDNNCPNENKYITLIEKEDRLELKYDLYDMKSNIRYELYDIFEQRIDINNKFY